MSIENPGTLITITSAASTTLIAGFSISEIDVIVKAGRCKKHAREAEPNAPHYFTYLN